MAGGPKAGSQYDTNMECRYASMYIGVDLGSIVVSAANSHVASYCKPGLRQCQALLVILVDTETRRFMLLIGSVFSK